jgi:hypothetical protein
MQLLLFWLQLCLHYLLSWLLLELISLPQLPSPMQRVYRFEYLLFLPIDLLFHRFIVHFLPIKLPFLQWPLILQHMQLRVYSIGEWMFFVPIELLNLHFHNYLH